MNDEASHYTPVMAAAHWAVIGPFVRSAVVEAAPLTPYSERQLYAAASVLTLWAWQTAAMPLLTEVIFSPPVVDRFIAEGMPQYTPAGRGSMRSRLRRMAEALLGPDRLPDVQRPMGGSDPSAPYTDRELATLLSWAASQGTPSRRSSAHALLSLGLGAGLAGREIVALRLKDISADDLGVLVHVAGEKPRVVPVLRDWEVSTAGEY